MSDEMVKVTLVGNVKEKGRQVFNDMSSNSFTEVIIHSTVVDKDHVRIQACRIIISNERKDIIDWINIDDQLFIQGYWSQCSKPSDWYIVIPDKIVKIKILQLRKNYNKDHFEIEDSAKLNILDCLLFGGFGDE